MNVYSGRSGGPGGEILGSSPTPRLSFKTLRGEYSTGAKATQVNADFATKHQILRPNEQLDEFIQIMGRRGCLFITSLAFSMEGSGSNH